MLILASACAESDGPTDRAEVIFRLETLCSFALTIDLRIDGGVVGSEVFRANPVPPTPERVQSNTYVVSAGQSHVLGATWGDHVWADTTITLVRDQKHQQVLFLYCS